MIDRDDEDRISALSAVRAEPDPVLWIRVRARLEADEPVGGLLGWLMRPAAFASSLAALALSLTVSVLLVASAQPTTYTSSSDLTGALLSVPTSPLEEVTAASSADSDVPADTEVAR